MTSEKLAKCHPHIHKYVHSTLAGYARSSTAFTYAVFESAKSRTFDETEQDIHEIWCMDNNKIFSRILVDTNVAIIFDVFQNYDLLRGVIYIRGDDEFMVDADDQVYINGKHKPPGNAILRMHIWTSLSDSDINIVADFCRRYGNHKAFGNSKFTLHIDEPDVLRKLSAIELLCYVAGQKYIIDDVRVYHRVGALYIKGDYAVKVGHDHAFIYKINGDEALELYLPHFHLTHFTKGMYRGNIFQLQTIDESIIQRIFGISGSAAKGSEFHSAHAI